MLLNLFYVWIALMPFLSISPWQVIVAPPFYYGFVYYGILFILSLLTLWNLWKGKLASPFSRKDLLVLGYVLVCILTLVLNWNIPGAENPQNEAGFTRLHIYNVFLIIYLIANISSVFVIRCIVISKEYLNKILQIITVSAILACLWGIVMVWLHVLKVIPDEMLALGTYFPRLMGTATEPQVFGNYLILPLFIALAFLLKNPSIKTCITVFILATALIMTYSAGAWIGAFVAAVTFLAINFRYFSNMIWRKLIIILIALILFISMLALIYPKYTNSLVISKFFFWNISKEITEYKVTKDYPDDKLHRTWMAQAAVNMFMAKPLLGVGTGNYGYLFNKYKPDYVPPFDFLVKTHNAYLEILAETGSIGFALFSLWLLLNILPNLKKALLTDKQDARLMLSGSICAFIGILAHGSALGIFAHNHTWIALGLIITGDNIFEA